MQIPHADEGLICPLHREDMSKVCHKCPLWFCVRGSDPNTGAEVHQWNCSLAWMPMLLIENAQQSRQAGAAIESFRNETVKASEQRTKAIAEGFEQMNGGRLVGPRN